MINKYAFMSGYLNKTAAPYGVGYPGTELPNVDNTDDLPKSNASVFKPENTRNKARPNKASVFNTLPISKRDQDTDPVSEDTYLPWGQEYDAPREIPSPSVTTSANKSTMPVILDPNRRKNEGFKADIRHWSPFDLGERVNWDAIRKNVDNPGSATLEGAGKEIMNALKLVPAAGASGGQALYGALGGKAIDVQNEYLRDQSTNAKLNLVNAAKLTTPQESADFIKLYADYMNNGLLKTLTPQEKAWFNTRLNIARNMLMASQPIVAKK